MKKRLITALSWLSVKSWFDDRQEWLNLVFIFLTLAIAIYSVEQSQWITPQPPLILILLLAMLTTLVLSKSQLPNALKHTLIMLLGSGIALWQLSNLSTPLPWWSALSVSPNKSMAHFTLFIILVTWAIGYISTWARLRRQNVWIAVFFGLSTVIVNLSNLPREYYYFFPLYILAAMLLIGQTNLAKQQRQLKKHGRGYPNHNTIYFTSAVVGISVLAISSTLFLPEIQLNRLSSAISTKIPWKNSEQHWLNIFAAVPGKWDIIRSEDQKELSFSDPIPQSDEILFTVNSNHSSYWRTRRYHTYLSWGWTNNDIVEYVLHPTSQTNTNQSLKRQELTYVVKNKLKTDVLLTAGEFTASNIPVLRQTLQLRSGIAQLTDGSEDIMAITAPRLLQPEERYVVTVSTLQTTAAQLSQAGTDYNPWITEHYLQLPDNLPERVRQLGQKLATEAKTPYDKVMAIKVFLQEFKYFKYFNEAIKAAPQKADGVDYFLFEKGEGNCNQFASAMVVLLRSLGVPARLSVGYRLEELEEDSSPLVIRARDYHAWAEVYFPGYGWIGFETVPGVVTGENFILQGDDITNIDSREPDPFANMDEPFYEGFTTSGTAPTPEWRRNAYRATISILPLLIITLGIIFYRRWLKYVRRAEDATDVYAKMCFLASLTKSGPRPAETPLEYCVRLILAFPLQSEVIDNIAQVYIETRFSSQKELDRIQRIKLHKSWTTLYPVFLKRVLRFRR